jgi:hypothetical protein
MALRLMYATPVFRWTGRPLARLISNVGFPGANLLLPRNPLFDAAFYAKCYPDVARVSKNLWAHYLAYGVSEGRQPHPWFQTTFYLARNPDVSEAGINPLVHYVEYGAAEGRDPRADFDTSAYLRDNPDVRRSGTNPLLHFCLDGKAEGRKSSATNARAAAFSPPPDHPSISVIMPTFNTPARYLKLAIESVLRQDFGRWQLCIHDDGSTAEETREILKEYQRADPRIIIQFGSDNQGIAKATNSAMAMASGEYMALLDHDDEILPEALSEVDRTLLQAGLVSGDVPGGDVRRALAGCSSKSCRTVGRFRPEVRSGSRFRVHASRIGEECENPSFAEDLVSLAEGSGKRGIPRR